MAHVTAGKFPIHLGDKVLLLTPLTDKDIEEINNWFRAEFVKIARMSFDDSMTQDERAEVLQCAMREARESHWMSASGERVIKTPEGMARVLWQSFKKEHPSLTVEEVRELIMTPGNLEMALTVWREVNVPESSGKAASSEKKLRQPRPRKRKPTVS